ncbi:hypothetical protein Psta_4756 [Pirellula staleyi DSM 6068]|uniref:DUF8091 domain-containing protein n=1 Tax=Pirellula staleyi (strain ATCC 27377 / DSM 6068 / ICPB 4128) TaxID=530564 RepID=D2R8U7_PIRSD|nr:hypothetical protein [Pirellula staleyi]ADB19397.1 hypothetical protein Psta_4756 [Pirellula staleyi DSM 6068]
METSLHKQLKMLYAGDPPRTEERVDGFRIDAVRPLSRGKLELVEVQHGSLSAIRDKIAKLCEKHIVRVVKPIVRRKVLVRLDAPGGTEISRRLSPKQASALELFEDLVYFTRVFPHKNLVLETVLVDIEERRFEGHGRRRRWSKKDFQVEDQQLLEVHATAEYRTAMCLAQLLPGSMPKQFGSLELAQAASIKRHIAQKICYTLRRIGTIRELEKIGNSRQYELAPRRKTVRQRG